MKRIVFVCSLIFWQTHLFAQNVNLDWAKSIGLSGDEMGQGIKSDRYGNVYTTGYFTGRVDFDPGKDTFFLSSFGSTDIFLTKYSGKGKFLWAIKMGGSAADQGNALAVDTSGNVFVTGYFQAKADFDPSSGVSVLSSAGRSDAFVCKIDTGGKLLWAKKFGGRGDDVGKGIAWSLAGNIYTTGYFEDTITYTISTSKSILISFGASEAYISKMDASGNLSWLLQMGGSTVDEGHGIAVDFAENVYTTGFFTGKADFNPGSVSLIFSSFGDADIYVSKLNKSGTYVWAKQLGGRNYDAGNGVAVDGSGYVYSTGNFFGTCDFDPSGNVVNLASNGDGDVYVSRLDANGNYSWAKQIGGNYADIGQSIVIDNASNLYATGSFRDKVDFDPSSSNYYLTSVGGDDVFIVKLTTSGNFQWAKNFGGTQNEVGNSVFVNGAKNVYTTGGFYGKCDFDPDADTLFLSSNGNLDGFINKLKICSASNSTLTIGSCYSYTLNGSTYTNTGTYYQTVQNSKGCDSLITLKLTIYNTTFNNMTVLACGSYTLNGITYSSPGNYNQTLVNSNGCDSLIILDLSFGENTGSISPIACNSYTLNGQTYTNTGIYYQTLKNKVGCDSNLTIKLTIKKQSYGNMMVTACDSFTLLGKSYLNSGNYTAITKNRNDCDSVISLNLIIYSSTSSKIIASACSTYTLNNKVYDKTGNYTQKLINNKGCDSIIQLNLSINNTISNLTQSACKVFSLNGKAYKNSGIYEQILVNAKGCDSTLSINLTIKNVNTEIIRSNNILIAEAVGSKYQWLDCDKNYAAIVGENTQTFIPDFGGTYAVEVTENSCKDTSKCIPYNLNFVYTNDMGEIKIWPQPVETVCHLKFEKWQNYSTLKIIDILGRTMQIVSNITGEYLDLDLSQYHDGIYFIEIDDGKQMRVIKLVKKD